MQKSLGMLVASTVQSKNVGLTEWILTGSAALIALKKGSMCNIVSWTKVNYRTEFYTMASKDQA